MYKFSQDNTKPVLTEEYDISKNDVVFGIVARLSPEKRHLDYVEAAKIAHKQNPNMKFFIIGDGPMRQEIEKQIEGCDYIIMTGMRRDVPNILRSLDCFVLCSEVESLPLSIREAMSMKLPVVVTDVGGNREIVADGVTGLLVDPHRPNELADAMLRIASDKDSRKDMGERAWRFCKDRFDARDWAKYTESKMKNMISNFR